MAQDHTQTVQILKNLLARLSEMTVELPFKKRSPARRSADGHLLFFQAPDFIADICYVLDIKSELYQDLPEPSSIIRESQELAELYYELFMQFQTMTSLCQQSHLYYQADAVRRARTDLDFMRLTYETALLDPGIPRRDIRNFHLRRLWFLYPALITLRQIRGHGGSAGKGKAKPRKPTPPADVQAPDARPRKRSPGKIPGKKKISIGARLFAAFLGREDPDPR